MKNKFIITVAFATIFNSKIFAERRTNDNADFRNRNEFHQRSNQPSFQNENRQQAGQTFNHQQFSSTQNFQTDTRKFDDRNQVRKENFTTNNFQSQRTNTVNDNTARKQNFSFENNDDERRRNQGNGGRNDYGHGRNYAENRGTFHPQKNWFVNAGRTHQHSYIINGRSCFIGFNSQIYQPFGYDVYATDDNYFDDFMYSLTQEDYEKYRFEMAMDFVENNYMSSNQVYAILEQFDFERNKLEIAKVAFRNVIDKENFYEVFDELNYERSRCELYRMMNYGC
jgi:Domain of unknown function (DUF4476)